MNVVKFAIPKGSLEKATFHLLEQAWYNISYGDRTYRPVINDPEIKMKMLRPQEIPVFVSEGLQDVGITGEDWIKETQVEVKVLLNLGYGSVKIVVAIPKNLPVNSLSNLLNYFWSKNKSVRFSSEYLNIASDYIKNNPIYRKNFKDIDPLILTPWFKKGDNDKSKIFLSFGATEAKPPEDADAIIDVIQTGATLEQNNLKIIETIMSSSAVLITNKKMFKDPWKREKIYDIITLLKGTVDAKNQLHIFVNVKKSNLHKLLTNLPALKKPTISPLSEEGWCSVNTVINKDKFLKLLPILRKLSQGLVVHHPKQILSLEEITKCEEDEKLHT